MVNTARLEGVYVETSIVKTQDDFEALASEWNPLLERSANKNLFSSWEWQSTWWNVYQPGELFVVTVRDEDGQLVGIAPWFIDCTNPQERVIRGIGCIDVTDYVDIIALESHFEAVLNSFAEALMENKTQYDRINLCNMPESSPTYQQFPEILKAHGFTIETELEEVCPVITLPDEWDDYLSGLSKKDRHELRRKMRRAYNMSQIDTYTVDDSHDLNEQIELFTKLMIESAPDKAEFMADDNNRAFFETVLPMMYANGWLKIEFITVNDTPSAAYLNFHYDNRIMVYNSGLSQEHMNLSPGIVLLGLLIRTAIEQNYDAFDFLRGNERYKYHMGGQDTQIFQIRAQATA